MFAFDCTKFVRWLPIHVKDMAQLKEIVPSVRNSTKETMLYRSQHMFFQHGIGSSREQMNDFIKGNGGAVGITDNPSALING